MEALNCIHICKFSSLVALLGNATLLARPCVCTVCVRYIVLNRYWMLKTHLVPHGYI